MCFPVKCNLYVKLCTYVFVKNFIFIIDVYIFMCIIPHLPTASVFYHPSFVISPPTFLQVISLLTKVKGHAIVRNTIGMDGNV